MDEGLRKWREGKNESKYVSELNERKGESK